MLVSHIKEENLTAEVIDRLLFQGWEDSGEAQKPRSTACLWQ